MKPRAYAKIRYIDDKVKQVVPVDDILEFQSNPDDAINMFKKDSLYTVLWHDENSNEPIPLAVQIASIKVLKSEEELEEFTEKRGVFTVLSDSMLDQYYDDSPEEEKSDSETLDVSPCRKGRNNKGKKLSDKTDVETQKKIFQLKKQKMMEAAILDLGNISDGQSQNVNGCVSPLKIVTQEKETKIKSDGMVLQMKLLQAEKNCLILKQENIMLKNNLEVLNERLETFKIINESLQVKLITLEKKLEQLSVKEKDDEIERQMEFIHGTSTPNKAINNDISTGSPKSYLDNVDGLDDDVHSTPQPSLNSVGNSSPTSPNKVMIERENASGNKMPKFTRRRTLNFEDESSTTSSSLEPSKKLRVSEEEERTDSGMGDYPDHGVESVPSSFENSQVSITDEEFQTMSRGLLQRKKSNVKKGKHDGPSTPTKHEKESTYFANFGHKESIVNSEQVTVNYIWLNKEKRILYDEWKQLLNLKDERKFAKACLRILHTNENGLHQENLSKRCVSMDKVAYSPGGTTRRIPLTWAEHTTIEKCLKYYCKKKLKLSDDKIESIIKTKNAILTEEINYCLKNQKKKSAK